MKKSHFLWVFIFTAISVNAQTRSETLQWISSKINMYNNNETHNCPIENAISNWAYKTTCDTSGKVFETSTWSDETASSTTILTADLIDLTNVTIEQDNKCASPYTFIRLVYKPNTVWWQNKKDGQVGKGNSIGIYLKWDAEEDLQNRMIKAFKHLIDLQRPKEIF